jgi:hypothetical protein
MQQLLVHADQHFIHEVDWWWEQKQKTGKNFLKLFHLTLFLLASFGPFSPDCEWRSITLEKVAIRQKELQSQKCWVDSKRQDQPQGLHGKV